MYLGVRCTSKMKLKRRTGNGCSTCIALCTRHIPEPVYINYKGQFLEKGLSLETDLSSLISLETIDFSNFQDR